MSFEHFEQFGKILHQIHKDCTLHKPIKVHEFSMPAITDMNLPDNIKLLTKDCLKKFKTTEPGKLYTTIDSDPIWWTNLVINCIKVAINKNRDINKPNIIVYIPNGCCTVDKCPLLQYYTIVVDEIVSLNQ